MQERVRRQGLALARFAAGACGTAIWGQNIALALRSIDRAGRTVSLTDASGTIVCQKGMLEAARDPALRDRLQLVPRFTELLRKAPSA